LHWQAQSGEEEVFQGNGPAKLAPYVTVGKGCGDFHVLATTGYLFPSGSGWLAGPSPCDSCIGYPLPVSRRTVRPANRVSSWADAGPC